MLSINGDDHGDLNIKLDMDDDRTLDSTFNKIESSSQQIDPRLESKVDSLIDSSNVRSIPDMVFNKLGLATSSQPHICFLHLMFKAAAILYYIFGGVMMNSVSIFIWVSIFSVMDFWVTKNITGRLLVGLRWWSVVDENGVETWKFETLKEYTKDNSIDRSVFWKAQIAVCLFWSFILFIKLVTFAFFYVG